MTTQTLYRFLCDAPHCTAAALAEDLKDIPADWRVLKSTDHIPIPPRRPPWQRNRRSNRLSYGERCRGSFALHLCPDHPDAFDAHLPITEGLYTRPGKDGQAEVSCSCGAKLGTAYTGRRLVADNMTGPSHYPENLWWRHLPSELQWYANRDAKPAQP